jgi:CDP-diacylglycerol pyrophosphatase
VPFTVYTFKQWLAMPVEEMEAFEQTVLNYEPFVEWFNDKWESEARYIVGQEYDTIATERSLSRWY